MWLELQSQAWDKLNLRNVGGFFKFIFQNLIQDLHLKLPQVTMNLCVPELTCPWDQQLLCYTILDLLPLSAYSQITKMSICVSPGSTC